MKQNVEKVDSDILVYSDELRKRLDKRFNEMLDEGSNFNSFYVNGTLYLNFNILRIKPIDSIGITLKIKGSE
jgi:hypothetical protein